MSMLTCDEIERHKELPDERRRVSVSTDKGEIVTEDPIVAVKVARIAKSLSGGR